MPHSPASPAFAKHGPITRELVASLRSWMFVPTSPDRFMRKAPTLPVDAIILDLEDGVVPAERPRGRENLREWLTAREPVFPVPFVRINAVGTSDWELDVAAVAGAAGVVLPKADSPEDVKQLSGLLASLEEEHDLQAGSTRIVAAIESTKGLLDVAAIAAADERICALLFGAEDFALDLGLPLMRTGSAADLIDARSSIAVGARSAGVVPIDGVHTELGDEAGLRSQSFLARGLGYSGKSLFHPAQISTINEEFTPSKEELEFAHDVIAAFDEASESTLQGAVKVGNYLVDLPIAERAKRLIQISAELTERGT